MKRIWGFLKWLWNWRERRRLSSADILVDIPEGENLYVYDIRRKTLRLLPSPEKGVLKIGGGKRYLVAKDMRKALLKVRRKEFVYEYN